MSRPDNERVQQARAGAHEARQFVHRRRFGFAGTEPPEGRSSIRHWGSIGVGVVAFIVSFAQVEAGAALAVVSLALGVPRSWTWANDRFSSLTWVVAVAMLVVGEILFIVGGPAIRRTSGSGHGPGAASILVAFSSAVAVVGYYRRWGTAGNAAYWHRQLRKGDPAARQAAREYAEKSGRTWPDADG
jgi:hypothetical protein